MADHGAVWPHRVSPDEGRPGATPPTKILVVEDDPQQAEVLAAILADAGFAVRTTQDGLEALYLLDTARPDLVLLDLNVPSVSGFRLLRLLKRDPATAAVPVLVLTALDFSEAKEAAQEGADAFLSKPFDLDDLVTRVQQLVDRVAPAPLLARSAGPAAGSP